MPGAVLPLSAPGSCVCVARQQRVHVGYEVVETRAVLRGRRRGGGLWLRGDWGSVQTGRGGAEEAGGVGKLVRAVLRLDGKSCAASPVDVRSPFPFPPEVSVVKHLLTVGVQRPIISFTLIKAKYEKTLIKMVNCILIVQ